jgi:hypothetical protein
MKLIAAFALLAVVAPASPQGVSDALELTRQKVDTQRRFLISGALPLTDDEAKAFWPLFDGYQKEREKLDRRANRFVADFVAALPGLTDKQAGAFIDETLQIEEERLRVRRLWLGRMARALPPRKLARYLQLENKLDAVVRADVARQIPLAP